MAQAGGKNPAGIPDAIAEVKTVLENSRKEAIRHNNSIITPEHLFLALLADTGSRVFSLLERASRNVSVYQLRTQLDDSLYDACASWR